MQSEKLKEDSFEVTPCTVGVLKIAETGEYFSCYAVDFGSDMVLSLGFFLQDQPINLNVDERENERYVYCVHGSQVCDVINSEGIVIRNSLFSSVFETNKESHDSFQEQFSKSKVWMLIVQGVTNLHFIVGEFGEVLDCYETSRENVIKKGSVAEKPPSIN